MITKNKRIESKKLRYSARGQDCMVRLPGICNFNPETTVLAHLNGGGMGTKKSDLLAAFCCSSCHDEIDGRTNISSVCEHAFLELYFRKGVERTQEFWLQNGFITIK